MRERVGLAEPKVEAEIDVVSWRPLSEDAQGRPLLKRQVV